MSSNDKSIVRIASIDSINVFSLTLRLGKCHIVEVRAQESAMPGRVKTTGPSSVTLFSRAMLLIVRSCRFLNLQNEATASVEVLRAESGDRSA